jgi:DNA sulfur modification protein DndC
MSLNIKHLENEIIDQYLYDENFTRPWIIGFSGGKDSTMLLQLVWNAIKQIPIELRSREIYVVCNDTLVENPKIVQTINKTLANIQKVAAEQSMPISVTQTKPKLEDTFWVKLIGKGYPAPNNSFRWCTDRLKINPTTQFILDKVNEKGEAIILLGTRSDESSNRAKSIKKHEIKGNRLRKHILPNSYVYAPITDVLIDELWPYLLQNNPPWGGTNRELVTLYRNASGGDCPLVIDTATPSCGNSRFGCWVCTVVKKDKSMDALIDNGEDWMEPLADFRDLLVETRDNLEWRDDKRRNGQEGIGPYLPQYRALFLQKLLEAQKLVQESQPDMQLITHQELVAIQLAWFRDFYFKRKVSDIYNEINKTQIEMSKQEEKVKQEVDLLKDSCKGDEKQVELIQELLALQKSKSLMMKKRGLQSDIESRIQNFLSDKAK